MKMGIYKIGDFMNRKHKKKKILLLSLFILISFFIFSFVINDKTNDIFIAKQIKDLNANISKIGSLSFLKTNDNYNKELVKEINKDYQKEITELKKTLELNKTNSDKKLINSVVIKRSSNYWYNIITIDKGSKDKIKVGYAVINNQGLIGKVIKVNNNSSDIKLLTSLNNKNYISASFNYDGKDYYGLISKYNIEKNELKFNNVIGDFDKNKIINTSVITSGLSDSFSSGLLIGKIKDIKKDTFGLSNSFVVTPIVNFNNLNIVTVVVGDIK